MLSTLKHRFRHVATNIPLRWVLVVPFVVQTVGAVGLVGYLSYRSGQQAVEKLAYQLMEGIGHQVTQGLDQYVQSAQAFNQRQIAAIESGVINPQNLNQLHRYLILQHRQDQGLTTLLFGTPQGDLRVSHRVSPRDFGITTQLKPGEIPFEAAISAASSPATNKTYSTTETGELGRYLETIEKIDVRDRPWYRMAIATKRPGWTSPFQIGSTNLLALNAYSPFYDKAGQLLGVFAVNISLNQLGDFLADLAGEHSGEIFIVEPNGLLIANSTVEASYSVSGKPDLGGSTTPGTLEFRRRRPSDLSNQTIQDAYTHLRETFGDFSALRSPQSLHFQTRGNYYFLTSYPYTDSYGLDWLVITAMPRSNFTAEIEANNARTVLLCWFTLFATTTLGALTARWITKPISTLSQANRALAQGEWRQPISEQTPIAELKTLTQSFNQTATQLQRSLERTKLALYESEDKFAKIFRTSPDAVTIVSFTNGSHIETNDFFLELVGYSREEIIGHTALELGLLSDPETALTLQQALETQRRIQNYELELRTRTGEIKTGLLSSEVIEIEGQPCILSVFKDYSDRKRAEAALLLKTQELDRFFSVALDLLCIADTEGYFHRLNSQWEKTLGYSLKELEGTRFLDYVHPDDLESTLNIISDLANQNPCFDFVNRYRCRDGSYLWIEWRAVPVGTLVYAAARDITERKHIENKREQAEEALHFNIELFQQIVENTRDALYVYSFELQKYIYCNSVYQTMWEWGFEILDDHQKRFQCIYPDDRPIVKMAFEQETQGQPTDIEYRIILPDGNLRWVHNRTYPVHNLHGKLTRLAGILEDISERKHAEEQLRNSEERLRIALSAARMGSWDWNILTNQITWSESLGQMTGFEPDTFDGRIETVAAMVYPDDRQRVSEAIRRSIRQGNAYDVEFRFVRSDGSIRWALAKGNVLRDSTGKAVRMAGVGVDITDRKLADSKREQAEAALRESEERFRLAFDDAAIGMAIVSMEGQFTEVNQALCEMTGYSETELLHRTFHDITYPDDLAADLENVQRLLVEKRRSFQMEKRYVHKQGHIIWVILSTSIIRDSNGTPLYFVSQIQDISDRHSADRVKDEFISVVSHELRTPLTGIRGALGLLKSGKFDDQPETFSHILQMALNNSDRLIRLVNDILDLERLESGAVELMKETCDVPELLKQAADTIQTLAAQESLTIHLRAPEVKVNANFEAIVQALTNLLSNAIKFSPSGGTIWLSADLVDAWANRDIDLENAAFTYPIFQPPTLFPYLLFSVTDQGRGIPPDKLDAVFGRFQQVDVSDARQKGGTGLGLAICKSIVQQHDGYIWVESGLGFGSTFYFTLPL